MAPNYHGIETSGERLRVLREEKGLTQDQVAKNLNLSRSVVVKLENNRQELKSSLLCSFAEYYSTTADYILGLSNARRAVETLPACDELGLSDDATVKLEDFKCRGRYGRLLSKVIEHEYFEYILWYAESAILDAGFYPNPLSNNSDLSEMAMDKGFWLIPLKDKRGFCLYRAHQLISQLFADISEVYYPYEGLEKDEEAPNGKH